MQAVAFLLVATGNYLNTGNWHSLVFQVLLQLPSMGACCQALSAKAFAIDRPDSMNGLPCVLSAGLPVGFCEPGAWSTC